MRFSVHRVLSSSYLFALFCFLLPFVTVSCPGEERSFSGLQLATGTTIEQPQLFGPVAHQSIGSEPLAGLALLCTIAGFAASLKLQRRNVLAAVALGACGALFLVFLRARIYYQVMDAGQGMVRVAYGPGYWLALMAFGVAIALGIHLYPTLSGQPSGDPVARPEAADPRWTTP